MQLSLRYAVDLLRFQAKNAVFDKVGSTDTEFSRHLVELPDELKSVHLCAI